MFRSNIHIRQWCAVAALVLTLFIPGSGEAAQDLARIFSKIGGKVICDEIRVASAEIKDVEGRIKTSRAAVRKQVAPTAKWRADWLAELEGRAAYAPYGQY